MYYLKSSHTYLQLLISQGFECLRCAEHGLKHHRALIDPLNKIVTLKIFIVQLNKIGQIYKKQCEVQCSG